MVEVSQTPEEKQDWLRDKALAYMAENGEIADSTILAEITGCNSQEVYAALNSLVAEEYVEMSNIESRFIQLTAEGSDYAKNGTPEVQYVSGLEVGVATPKTDVEQRMGAQKAKIGFGKAMKQKWIKGDKVSVTRTVEVIEDKD